MSRNTDNAKSALDLQLSTEASPYILLQRIDTQRWNPSNWLPEHQRPFDGLYRNLLLKLESMVRHQSICNQYLDQMQTEFQELKPHLPETADTVLDIGCGMAGIDLFLWQHYRSNQPKINLFDKSEISDDLYYEFYDQAAFYNSLQTARKNLTLNGIPDSKIQTIEATQENLNTLQDVDICISLYSWGFHYPVETYIEGVTEILTEQGNVILDIRKETERVSKDTNGFQICEEAFENVIKIKEDHKYRRILCQNPVPSSSVDVKSPEPDRQQQESEPEPSPVGIG